MSDSIRDQLMKAGLVTRDQANRAQAKSRRKQKPKQGPESPEAAKQREVAESIAKAEADKRNRDRELNRKRDHGRALKARRAELRKQLAESRKNDGKGEITHYFQSGKKVKQVMVNAEQQADLIAGRLGIVVMDGVIHLVSRELAETVRAEDPESRVVIVDPDAEEQIEDEYKDYAIPDDLQW